MSNPAKPRLHFLDWSRGIAALIMLQGHVFDAFATGDQRQSSEYILSQFVGGMPPAIFLFLTGVTLAFLMESQERKELGIWEKLKGIAFRGRYLLILAFLFRFQMWLFALPKSPVSDLFRVDILNCMGVSILLMTPLAFLGRTDRIRWGIFAGLGIAAVSPLIANADWSSTPLLFQDYLVPSGKSFSIFPWAAFLAFGVATGTILKIASSRDLGRFAQWCAIGGLALIFSCQHFSNLPYSIYAQSDFWINSPWLILIKTGIIMVLLAVAYLWTTHVAPGWSFVRQLGMTSLLVYWVHTELVYGRWLWFLKGNLSIPQITLLAISVILVMLGLSVMQTRWSEVRQWALSRGGRFSIASAEGD